MPPTYKNRLQHIQLKRFDKAEYLAVGWRLSPWVGGAAFLGCWYYAFMEYGFLLGVGLGWFPAALVGLLAGTATIFLWGPMVAAVVIAGVFVATRGQPAENVGLGRPEANWERGVEDYLSGPALSTGDEQLAVAASAAEPAPQK